MDAQLAVITGASTGIGRQLAKEFARNGFDLVLSADDDALDDVTTELRGDGHQVWSVRGDLSTYPGVTELVERIESLDRPIDVLILNAGVGIGGPFVGETPRHDQLRVVDLNVSGTLHLAKRLLPAMVERGSGRLAVVSSTVAGCPAHSSRPTTPPRRSCRPSPPRSPRTCGARESPSPRCCRG